MSPLGKPDADGNIVSASRFSKQSLGTLTIWDCPSCGVKNEGRRPEQGCVHCGAGDPTKSRAGEPARETDKTPLGQVPAAPAVSAVPPIAHGRQSPRVPADVQRIYRIIEYAFTNPASLEGTLRRSLVGSLSPAAGLTITATIIDTLDAQQEDRLRMARMQPGVWLANPDAMHAAPTPHGLREKLSQLHLRYSSPAAALRQEFSMEPPTLHVPSATPPPTGPAYTEAHAEVAQRLCEILGYKIVHTLALALSSIAEELASNAEPEKFLGRDECLQLANALLHAIPDGWEGDIQTAAPEEELF